MSRKGTTTPPAKPQRLPAVHSPRHSGVYLGMLGVLCVLFYIQVLSGRGWFWEDLIHQEYPHRIFARNMFLSFQFPHWNPYTFGGMPFFSALHTGTLYPFNILLSLIPAAPEFFWYLLQLTIVLHVFAAGACMYLLARDMRFSRPGSFLAGLGYMLCGFFVTHVIHSLMIATLAWTPLVMLLTGRALRDRRAAPLVWSGLVLGASVLAGHPQITLYQFLFLGLYTVHLLRTNPPFHPSLLLRAAVPFVIAIGVALVQLLPAAELSTQTVRSEWTLAQAAEGSLSWRQLGTAVAPRLFGGQTTNPDDVPFWLDDSPLYRSGRWTFWETCFYSGIAVLLLGMAAMGSVRRDPFVQMAAAAMGGALLVALGDHFLLYPLLVRYVPGFGSFRFPARIMFVWNLLLPLLAARTFDRLRTATVTRSELRTLLLCAGAALLYGLFIVSGGARQFWIELEDPLRNRFALRQGWIMLLFLVSSSAAVILLVRGRIGTRAAGLALIAIAAADLFLFGFGLHVQSQESAPRHFSLNSTIATFLRERGTREVFRANIRDLRRPGYMLLRRNQGMIDNIQMLAGYNPLHLQRKIPPAPHRAQLDLMNVSWGIQIDPTRQSMGLAPNPDPLPRARMFYRWRVFAADSGVITYMQGEHYEYRRELVLERQPSVDPVLTHDEPDSRVEIIDYRPNRIELTVNTAAAGMLWLSELDYPAWRCRVNGLPAPILRANHVFRSVELDAGEHTVVFTFESRPFLVGLVLTLLTLALCALVLAVHYRSNRRGAGSGASFTQR